MWSRNHVIRWYHHYGKGTYSCIILTEREKYNLSLDVVDLLSTASSFDTHTFAHHAWRTSTTCDNLVAVSICCSINSPYNSSPILQYLTLANLLLLQLLLNPFHESSLQYIGRDCLVTWIECNPKISGDSLICQPFELQLILLEDSF